MTIADKVARIGNFIIDSLLILVLIILQALVLNTISEIITTKISSIFDIYCVVFYFCYYLLFEYFFGKTPGKFLTKTMVVNPFGKKPTLKSLLIRSVARLIPYDHFSFVFGQGLHDNISKSAVVTI